MKRNVRDSELLRSVRTLVWLTVLCGGVYPAVVTGLAQILFPRQADGSLIFQGNAVLGSELIGQPFDDSKYFWSRPSATSPYPYNSSSSSGSNLGPTNPTLIDEVKGRANALRNADASRSERIPADLVTSSASGLDPDISPATALYQVHRVAQARKRADPEIEALVRRHVEGRQWGLFGEPRVNVLKLNLDLDVALP